ncbi:cryptochrome/photolyase family protein [Cerasicoccus maritimus]|uniref:cryptochrome/photolyase family protein n=1 Tax=Cerasicoccus maritimus TaxID=490089 RepID=UPI002852786D|nr:cryptochrome/photolyase family protein [Cerasicoccus maritimus]
MSTAALIYPHQLFSKPPARDCPVYLIEEPLLFGTDRRWPLNVHRQRIVLHRASMQAYRKELEGRGREVTYVDLPRGGNSDSATVLRAAIPKDVERLVVYEVHDDVLKRRLQRFAEERGIELVVEPTPAFVTPAEFLEKHTGAGVKQPFMARFYQAQRKRMNILLTSDGKPVGGQWSFDADNRQKLSKDYPVPDAPRAQRNHYVDDAIGWANERFADNFGSLDRFDWPVTRAAALSWLQAFLDERLTDFGPYEDAISGRHRVLFHSALTPALNIGLLTPQEVVDAALAHAEKRDTPLNSLEGFVRQVIGWREFMAGIYRHRGVEIRNGNFWNFRREMPACFYDASTGIPVVDDAIARVLEHGYLHHIERLMVLGNFMLLCRIHPDAVYRWFMELFVDAYDWVMVPNVYGMSQFADGGTFTTKPYLSGSNYIRKMSRYAKGDWCATWDGLYWTFIGDHEEVFAGNHRMSMMARSWDKMDAAKKVIHRRNAEAFLAQL